MKLDPVFTVNNNQLYTIDSNSLVDTQTLKFIQIPWSTVEMSPEAYNEEYLASLRDQLKTLEALNQFAVLVPVVDKPLTTPEQIELFINAFNHTARRVKDCVSVAGYELPAELTALQEFEENSPANTFMETIAIKHAQYVYFTKLTKAPLNVVILG